MIRLLEEFSRSRGPLFMPGTLDRQDLGQLFSSDTHDGSSRQHSPRFRHPMG